MPVAPYQHCWGCKVVFCFSKRINKALILEMMVQVLRAGWLVNIMLFDLCTIENLWYHHDHKNRERLNSRGGILDWGCNILKGHTHFCGDRASHQTLEKKADHLSMSFKSPYYKLVIAAKALSDLKCLSICYTFKICVQNHAIKKISHNWLSCIE